MSFLLCLIDGLCPKLIVSTHGRNGGILSLGSSGHKEKKGLNTGTLVSSRWKNWKSADNFFNCGK
jgi:hypothetical protein